MKILRIIRAIWVTKEKQTTPEPKELEPFDDVRLKLLEMAADNYDLKTFERGQFLEIVFSQKFFEFHIKLIRQNMPPDMILEQLKIFVFNRVIPTDQLN